IAPQLINCSISNNYSNSDQMIIVTSKLSSSEMTYPGLAVSNCVIEKNTCGTIGYWVSNGTPSLFVNDTEVLKYGYRDSNLAIINNNCKFIASLDHVAAKLNVVAGASVNSEYNSGRVFISGNKCNWIHTGIVGNKYSSLIISHNKLSAGNTSALPFPSSFISSNGAISVKGSNSSTLDTLDDNICIIDHNTTSYGTYVEPETGLFTEIAYTFVVLETNVPSVITGNIFKGIGTGSGYVIL